MEIREARRDDVPAVVRMIAADAIREVAEDPAADGADLGQEYFAAYDEITADPKAMLIVVELDGEIVATAQLDFLRQMTYHGGLVAQVESVRTLDHLRGKGIGSALMEWILAEARRRGAVRVQLTSNSRRKDAHRFYERLGFDGTHLGMKLYLGTNPG